MPFNVTIANLIWSITSLLFAVKRQKTANEWLFRRRLDLQKAGVSAAESSSLAVVSLQITAKTATAPKLCQWAPPQADAIGIRRLSGAAEASQFSRATSGARNSRNTGDHLACSGPLEEWPRSLSSSK